MTNRCAADELRSESLFDEAQDDVYYLLEPIKREFEELREKYYWLSADEWRFMISEVLL